MTRQVFAARRWLGRGLAARLALLASIALLLVAPAPGGALGAVARPEPGAIGPQAVTSVSGTVESSLGGTVGSVDVWVLDTSDGSVAGTGLTLSSGFFSIPNITVGGAYELVLTPPAPPLVGSNLAARDGIFFSVPNPVAVSLGLITLSVASNTIAGVVRRAGAVQPGVTVVAYSQDVWQYSRTAVSDALGAYSIDVGDGRWSVYAEQSPAVNWVANQPPLEVELFGGSATRDLQVDPVDGHITGQVVSVGGGALSFAAGTASITLEGSDGQSITQDLASNGSFDIPVVADRYDYSVWLDQTTPAYQALSGPAAGQVEVINANVSLGQLALRSRSATISGTVTDGSGPVQGLSVVAWNDDDEQFGATTAANGSYQIKVSPGAWRVSPSVNGTSYLNSAGLARAGSVTNAQPLAANFALERAPGTIAGTVVDATSGQVIGDLEGWAYLRRPGSAIDLSVVPVISGTFTLPAPAEAVQVGLHLDQDSGFTAGPPASVPAGASSRAVTLQLQPNSATITGQLRNAALQPVTGVSGEITASALGDDSAVRRATIDPDTGSYTLELAPGDWLLSYQLEDDRYQANPNAVAQVSVADSATLTHDFTLIALDGYVKALVLDEDGNPLPNAEVWGQYGQQQISGQTDASGVVTIYVAYSDPPPVFPQGQLSPQGRQPPPVVLGMSSPNSDTEREPPTQPKGGTCESQTQRCQQRRGSKWRTWRPYPRNDIAAAQLAPADAAQLVPIDTAQLQVRSANSALTGTVLGVGGAPRAGAYVTAWSDDAQWISGVTNASGAFSLPVVRSAAGGERWRVTARYWDGASASLLVAKQSATVPAAANPATPLALGNLSLAAVAGVSPPPPQTLDFAGSSGLTITLPDQTQIVFPSNAVASSTVSSASTFDLRASLTAQVQLPDTDLNRLAGDYGYTITLSDKLTRRPISAPLSQNAVLTLHYTDAQLARAGVSAEQLRPAWYDESQASWQIASGFVLDRAAHTVSVEIRDLGNWALVASQVQSQIYMPLIRR